MGPIASILVSIGTGLGGATTTGVVSTILKSTAICTTVATVKNITSGSNNFEMGTQLNISIGDNQVKVSSKLVDTFLPKKDETVLLYVPVA